MAPLFREWRVACDAIDFVQHFWALASAREEADTITLRAPTAASLVRDAAAARGYQFTQAQAGAAWAAIDLPATEYGRALYPDAAETVRRLDGMGLAIAVVSNRMAGPGMLRADVTGFGINDHVDVIVCSADVGYRKPHRIIFQRALQALSQRPADVVMVGDNFENDVRGAKALGITAVLKTNGREVSAEEAREADFVVAQLADVLELGLFVGGEPQGSTAADGRS